MTTGGADFDSPGIIPWVDRSQQSVTYSLPNPANPGTPADPFPNYPQGGQPKPNYVLPPLNQLGCQPPGSEFMANNANAGQLGAGRAAIMGRLDLNRKLRSFFDATTGTFVSAHDAAAPRRHTPAVSRTISGKRCKQRQDFAKEIFDRLVLVTGANPGANTKGSPDQYNALQLPGSACRQHCRLHRRGRYLDAVQWLGGE